MLFYLTLDGAVGYPTERTVLETFKCRFAHYLSDEVLGIVAHDNLDASLKAKLIWGKSLEIIKCTVF
jgi:hypothetical protein